MLQRTCVFERNARTFDISKPLDAFNFVTFLCFLSNEHTNKLADLFEARCDQIAKLKPQNHVQHWTMAAQAQERVDYSRRSRSSKDNFSPADVNLLAAANHVLFPDSMQIGLVRPVSDNEDISIH